MADTARKQHVSPGIYSREYELNYAIRSLGITTLGVVGETLKGPAFQTMDIANWREFQDVFGGTSTEKFKGSQYPKYELPYIAKSFLSESEQLKVVRVLGLSGYNAGPAWIVTASGTDTKKAPQAVVVIRSRAKHIQYVSGSSIDCICEPTKFDTLEYEVGEVSSSTSSSSTDKSKTEIVNDKCPKIGYNLNALQIAEYKPLSDLGNECEGYQFKDVNGSFSISQTNRGRFKLKGITGKHTMGTTPQEGNANYFEYSVSLNPFDKDYILNVLGTRADDGQSPIYVESLYDIALEQGIASGELTKIDSGNTASAATASNNTYQYTTSTGTGLKAFQAYYTADYCHHEPIDGLLRTPDTSLNRSFVGRRYLCDEKVADKGYGCVAYDYNTNEPLKERIADLYFKTPSTKSDYLIDDNTKVLVGTYTREYYKMVKKSNSNDLEKKVLSSATHTVYKEWSARTSSLSAATSVPEAEPTTENDTGYTETLESGFTQEALSLAKRKMKSGQIYTVRQYTTQDGKRNYYYAFYDGKTVYDYFNDRNDTTTDTTNFYGNLQGAGNNQVFSATTNNTQVYGNASKRARLVFNKEDGLYYKMKNTTYNDTKPSGDSVVYVDLDMNDYKSAYRYASTPWIVSNLKGDMSHVELNKLFRFHTISDGDNSNYEIKISIENIRPDDGTFDVVVRRIDDLDESIIPLERFSRCTMSPTDANYIAFKIGSFDGVYESKSKYITVEVNDTTAARVSVPCGFLGYPIPLYSGNSINDTRHWVSFPTIKYNRNFDEDIKNRKQYFGLSSWVGVDIDNFTFKGTKTYIETPQYISHGFHLDSRLDTEHGGIGSDKITVDGEKGYYFDAVSTNNRTVILSEAPIIGKESEMYGSIYEYVNLRKFTLYFYGGFDGWDIYRDQRSNGDTFKMTQYRGYINQNSGEGYSFNKIQNPELLELNQNGITSDWYAYLSAIRQFANPEATDINVFATPGIDYVNQKLLVQEAIEMIEEERADSIYVITTPDKPSGAGDYVNEMYTAEDAVYNLEDTEIDSNYSCTYYPWVKYLDVDNNQYIYLPPTKDVVRNFAQTDNTAYPWFAPAGVARGDVDCVRAHYITRLADEDVLYEGRINPIKTFAQDGPKVWGQKNLQVNESQLNRIAVRRLLLRMRKLIAVACLGLIFDQYDNTVKQSFISTVTPILDSIRSNRGISDYRIEVNDSLEYREKRELPVKIYFKAYNALEYISIDFILTAEGVSFDDI